jgi:hypothetical protein
MDRREMLKSSLAGSGGHAGVLFALLGINDLALR